MSLKSTCPNLNLILMDLSRRMRLLLFPSLRKKVLLNGYPRKMEVGLIGSCTNSSYQDLSRAASLAKQVAEKNLSVASPLIVNPGSEQIRATAERDGMIETFEQIGATIMANACGPCIGQWKRHTDDPTRKKFNRDFL